MARKPSLPKPKPLTSGVTSRSVSNTGEMATSTQKTGATGSVTNTTNYTTTQGAPGAPGGSSTGYSGTPNITPNLGSIAQIPLTREAVEGAYASAEGMLASGRQQALAQTPREYHDRVNSAFDTAHTHLADHKKKLGY